MDSQLTRRWNCFVAGETSRPCLVSDVGGVMGFIMILRLGGVCV